MNGTAKAAVSIFAAIIGLAIISVIISKKSRAPEAISALSTGLASIVAAAVSPQSSAATNGNNGASTFASPSLPPVPTFPAPANPVPMQY